MNNTFICQFCSKECKNRNSHSNHERLCPKNVNRVYKSATIGRVAWNKGLTKDTDDRVAKYAATLKETGNLSGKCADPEKEKLRIQRIKEGCKNNGGYRENAGRSKKFKILDSFGNKVCLQSTYELKCSEVLNELGIKWIRPRFLPYDNRKYFADFYLVDYQIYLDPKNSYKAKLDAEKISKVIKQNNVKLFVLLEHQITNEFITSLCS